MAINWPVVTVCVIVGAVAVLSAIDAALEIFAGNSATISWVMLLLQYHRGRTACLFCYSFGVLAGHLFLPAFHSAPPLWELLTRIGVVLLPIVLLLVLIASSGRNVAGTPPRLGLWDEFTLGIGCVVYFGIGILAGRAGCPQHVA